jgi:hypothetical protein
MGALTGNIGVRIGLLRVIASRRGASRHPTRSLRGTIFRSKGARTMGGGRDLRGARIRARGAHIRSTAGARRRKETLGHSASGVAPRNRLKPVVKTGGGLTLGLRLRVTADMAGGYRAGATALRLDDRRVVTMRAVGTRGTTRDHGRILSEAGGSRSRVTRHANGLSGFAVATGADEDGSGSGSTARASHFD